MPKLPWLSAAALCLMAAPAIAQEHQHASLVGIWKGSVDAVSIDRGGEDASPIFGSYAATIEITEQQNERFTGTFALTGGQAEPIVGVFTEPGRILWSEPGGIAQGRVINNEVIEVCFVRVTASDQVASCERYRRQE